MQPVERPAQVSFMFGGEAAEGRVWVKSLLADHAGDIEAGWLQPPVTVSEFLAPFTRHAKSYVQPSVRAELEAAIAADRAVIEATLQPGDELRPWRHPPYQDGCVGLAVVRGGQVVRAWVTARLV